jgi:hypothetical protein
MGSRKQDVLFTWYSPSKGECNAQGGSACLLAVLGWPEFLPRACGGSGEFHFTLGRWGSSSANLWRFGLATPHICSPRPRGSACRREPHGHVQGRCSSDATPDAARFLLFPFFLAELPHPRLRLCVPVSQASHRAPEPHFSLLSLCSFFPGPSRHGREGTHHRAPCRAAPAHEGAPCRRVQYTASRSLTVS